MTANIRDLEALFYGNGESAKYAALKAFADAGVDATDLLGLVGGGSGGTPTAIVERRATDGGGGSADYTLTSDDIGKLVVLTTLDALPIRVLIPDSLGSPANRIELFEPLGQFSVEASGAAFVGVPADKIATSRSASCLVLATKIAEAEGGFPEAWLLSYDLADGGG